MGPPSLTSFMKFALAVCALLIDNQTNGTETVPLPRLAPWHTWSTGGTKKQMELQRTPYATTS